jgi:hypothetical protein
VGVQFEWQPQSFAGQLRRGLNNSSEPRCAANLGRTQTNGVGLTVNGSGPDAMGGRWTGCMANVGCQCIRKRQPQIPPEALRMVAASNDAARFTRACKCSLSDPSWFLRVCAAVHSPNFLAHFSFPPLTEWRKRVAYGAPFVPTAKMPLCASRCVASTASPVEE